MRPSGSLPGTEKCESLGFVRSTSGQSPSLVSVKENMSWSTAISRYLEYSTIYSRVQVSKTLTRIVTSLCT